jgi:hypothetical protein
VKHFSAAQREVNQAKTKKIFSTGEGKGIPATKRTVSTNGKLFHFKAPTGVRRKNLGCDD